MARSLSVILLFSALLACASGGSTCNGKYNTPKTATPNCAFSSFTQAASVVVAGDTVNVLAGSFNEPGNRVTVSSSGTSTSRITFVGVAGATLNSTIVISGSYVTFTNITVSPYIPNGYYAIDLIGSNILVSNLTVTKYLAPATLQATVFGVEGNNITVSGCTVHDLTDIDIFHVWGHDNVIKNNYVHNVYQVNYDANHADFIQTWGFPNVQAYNILVTGNVVVNSTIQLGNTETDGYSGLHNWTFENNVFANIENALFWGVPSSNFVNNIFYNVGDAQGYSLSLYDEANYSSQSVSIVNNAFVANRLGDVEFHSADPAELRLFTNNYYGTAAGGVKSGGIYGNAAVNGGLPKFTNPAAYDFHLLQGSVLNGAGFNASIAFGFNTDKDGTRRTYWDIGPYASAFKPPTPGPTPKPAQSFYSGTTTYTPDSDTSSVTLGLKFSATVAGSVTGLMVYRGSGVSFTQGLLYNSAGTQLATLSFPASGSGWIRGYFTSAINITASSQYTAAYFAPSGQYAAVNDGFDTSRTVGNLLAPVGAGVYTYGSTAQRPTSSYANSEYFVSPLFVAA